MYEREKAQNEHLMAMNERLVDLCGKLSGDEALLKAQLEHKAPPETLKPFGGRRSWRHIAAELERHPETQKVKLEKEKPTGSDPAA